MRFTSTSVNLHNQDRVPEGGMGQAEDLLAAIAAAGAEVKAAKSDKTRTADQNKPLIDKLLALKAEYKAVTGEDPPAPNKGSSKKDKKAKAEKAAAAAPTAAANPEKAAKNAEKKAAKAAAKAEKEAAKAARYVACVLGSRSPPLRPVACPRHSARHVASHCCDPARSMLLSWVRGNGAQCVVRIHSRSLASDPRPDREFIRVDQA